MKTNNYRMARGWLAGQEREWLWFLASRTHKTPTTIILNIGVEYGASIVALRIGNPLATIIGIDIDNTKCEYTEMVDELITQDSRDVVKTWEAPINLLFIDGGHDEATVASDLKFADKVLVGGFLALHDCYDPDTGGTHAICPGVNIAVEKWLSSQKDDWTEYPRINSMRIFERMKRHGMEAAVNSTANISKRKNSN